MATLYQYSKDGTRLASYSVTTITGGGISHAGDNFFYVINGRFIVLCILDAKAGVLRPVETKLALAADVDGQGIAPVYEPAPSYGGEGEEWFPGTINASQFFTTEFDSFPVAYNINLYSPDFQLLDTVSLVAINNNNIFGCCYDGRNLFISYEAVGPVYSWRKYGYVASAATTFKVIDSGTFPALTYDMAFDESYIWVTEATTVTQYTHEMDAVVNSWSGPGTQRGITTNGQDIFLLTL